MLTVMNVHATSRPPDAAASRRPRPRSQLWRWLPPLPGFLLLLALTLPPFVYAVYLSFVNIDIQAPGLGVHFVGLENYREVLFTSAGISAVLNTLILSFGSTLLSVAIGLVAAYLIALYAGRTAGFIVIFVLIPLSVSPVAVALVFSLMLDPLYGPIPQISYMLSGVLISPTSNEIGARVVIILLQAWQWSPIAVILLLGGIQSLPKEPIEAALIDGATLFQTIRRIHMPLLRPLLAVTAIFEFILCSQVFAATQLLTNGGPGISTVDLSLYIYKVGIAEGGRVSVAAAAGVIALVIGLASTALWLRATRWEQEVYR